MEYILENMIAMMFVWCLSDFFTYFTTSLYFRMILNTKLKSSKSKSN